VVLILGQPRGLQAFLHVSRHKHAMRRQRGPGGRFLTKEEVAALDAEDAVTRLPNSVQPHYCLTCGRVPCLQAQAAALEAAGGDPAAAMGGGQLGGQLGGPTTGSTIGQLGQLGVGEAVGGSEGARAGESAPTAAAAAPAEAAAAPVEAAVAAPAVEATGAAAHEDAGSTAADAAQPAEDTV
jgi:hypothetical protein